jgi:hypothetical protein
MMTSGASATVDASHIFIFGKIIVAGFDIVDFAARVEIIIV